MSTLSDSIEGAYLRKRAEARGLAIMIESPEEQERQQVANAQIVTQQAVEAGAMSTARVDPRRLADPRASTRLKAAPRVTREGQRDPNQIAPGLDAEASAAGGENAPSPVDNSAGALMRYFGNEGIIDRGLGHMIDGFLPEETRAMIRQQAEYGADPPDLKQLAAVASAITPGFNLATSAVKNELRKRGVSEAGQLATEIVIATLWPSSFGTTAKAARR